MNRRWLVVMLVSLTFCTRLQAQGSIPITELNALGNINSDKTAITNGNTLNLVFVSGNKVQFTRSVGGTAWETPVPISGTLPRVQLPTIGAAADGTLGVLFLADLQSDYLVPFYTYKASGRAWSVPVAIGKTETIENMAMAIRGTQVHIAAANVFTLFYYTFPVQNPSLAKQEQVDSRWLCCAALAPKFPTIAVVPRPGGGPDQVYIAYGVAIKALPNSPNVPCNACREKGYTVGVRVKTNDGSPGNPWRLGEEGIFEDLRSSSTGVGSVNSLSLTSDASGDLFLAYQDFFCKSQTDCPAASGGSGRGMLARYNSAQKTWISQLITGASTSFDALSRNVATGANVRTVQDIDGQCRLLDFDWRGSATAVLLTFGTKFPACLANAQSVFFKHRCIPECEVKAIYIDRTVTPYVIRTYPDCPPGPDLAAMNVNATSSFYPGAVVPVRYRIANTGAPTRRPTTVLVTLMSGNTIVVSQETIIEQLTVGGYVQKETEFVLPASLATGTYTLAVAADEPSRICEGDEENNRITFSPVQVQAPPVCAFDQCTIRTVFDTSKNLVVPPVRFIVDTGMRGCALPQSPIVTWSTRTGNGPWKQIKSGPANFVDLDGSSAIEVSVMASNNASLSKLKFCIATTKFVPLNPNPVDR